MQIICCRYRRLIIAHCIRSPLLNTKSDKYFNAHINHINSRGNNTVMAFFYNNHAIKYSIYTGVFHECHRGLTGQ